MKIGKLKKLIERYVTSNNQNNTSVLYIQGKPGVGKSDIINTIGKENGIYTKVAYLATMLTEQVTGLPIIQVEENNDNKRVVHWSIPELLNFEGHTKGILFIDDVHLADEDIQKYLFQLLSYKSIHNHSLPTDVKIILAGNGDEDYAGANQFLAPVQNRVFTIKADIDFDAWYQWAVKHDVHSTILSFLSTSSNHECLLDEPQMGTPFSSPRAWANLSNQLNNLVDFNLIKTGSKVEQRDQIELLKEITCGHITYDHGVKFIDHVVYYSKFNAKTILNNNFDLSENVNNIFEASACLFVVTDYIIDKHSQKSSNFNAVYTKYVALLKKFLENNTYRPLLIYSLRHLIWNDEELYYKVFEDQEISIPIIDLMS